MVLRKNWISIQLSEAKESFKASPEWAYYNAPLQNIRTQLNDAPNKTSAKKIKSKKLIESESNQA